MRGKRLASRFLPDEGYSRLMNILVTTIGFSWQIVPELYGITNPADYPLFSGNERVQALHTEGHVSPVAELWVIASTDAVRQGVVDHIRQWGQSYHLVLRFFVCEQAWDFSTESQILAMRSVIYKTVFNAHMHAGVGGNVFLSLAGGRKTMSADIQQAGYLFGCRAMIHVMDLDAFQEKRTKFQEDGLLLHPEQYATCFLPVVVAEHIPRDEIVSGILFQLQRFLLSFKQDRFSFSIMKDDQSFLQVIREAQEQSSILWANFPAYLDKGTSFRKLFFLPQKTIAYLKKTAIDVSMRSFIAKLPKSDLHTHLGGVLTPRQIIRVAIAQRNTTKETFSVPEELMHSLKIGDVPHLIAQKNEILSLPAKQPEQAAYRFHRLIAFLCAFEHQEDLLERVIYDDMDMGRYRGVGIERYQRFGDLQGSSLLQTESTIREAVRCYGESLKADNVQYVELRCSPHKYTRCELTIDQVVKYICEEMDRIGIEYRLIFIIGRNASLDEMEKTVCIIRELQEKDPLFNKRFVGVDLAGNEGAASPKSVREVFLPLLERCMHVTIHAGETEAVENIWQAVYYLSADRIGHGLRLPNNPELMKRFLDKRIGIELCPSSNIQVVGAFNPEYPLRTFLEQGLKVTLNTDNMGISRTTPTNEFFAAASLFPKFTLWDCLVLIRNSLSVSFVDVETKRRLMHQFEDQIIQIIKSEGL